MWLGRCVSVWCVFVVWTARRRRRFARRRGARRVRATVNMRCSLSLVCWWWLKILDYCCVCYIFWVWCLGVWCVCVWWWWRWVRVRRRCLEFRTGRFGECLCFCKVWWRCCYCCGRICMLFVWDYLCWKRRSWCLCVWVCWWWARFAEFRLWRRFVRVSAEFDFRVRDFVWYFRLNFVGCEIFLLCLWVGLWF